MGLRSSGLSSAHLGSSGIIWYHLVSSGIIWDHLGSSGIIWDLGEFESVTGFQVVALADGYITFEGNGRRESLVRAFGGKDASIGIQVEVRLFEFKDEATRTAIAQQMERVRRWKNVVDV